MYKSLSVKVALPLAIAVTVVSIAINEAGAGLQREAVTRLTAARALSLTTLTLKTVNAVTQEGHRPDLQAFLNELAKDPDVMSVRVIDRKGVVRRSASKADIGTVDALFAESARLASGATENRVIRVGSVNVLRMSQQIPNAPSCRHCHGTQSSLGQIMLALAVSEKSESSLSWTLGLATNGLQVLTLVVLTVLIVSVLVSRPVRNMAKAMAQVQQGDLDVHVPPVGTREIDTVVVGFNAMVGRLREARRTEDETQRLKMERVEHLAAVGEMAAGLAHEIRNPVAGVKAAVEVLVGRMPHDDSRRQILRESISELNRVDDVVRDLLNYARPRPLRLAAADLNDLVRSAWTLAAAGASAAGVEGECLVSEQPLPVQADAGMIRQVVVNLILNAVQAMSGTSPRILRLTTATGPEGAIVSVCDSGPGVSASQAENVFKPFFTTKSRGTGLGLPISRRLVEMHGGRLWVANPGQPRAEFRFFLPLAAGSMPAQGASSGNRTDAGGPQ